CAAEPSTIDDGRGRAVRRARRRRAARGDRPPRGRQHRHAVQPFPDRGALLDAVLPDWVAEVDRLAKAALADPDPWRGFAGFMDGLFGIQARNRSMNDAIARTPVGPVDVVGECGHT